jgi:dipeptidyl aminopeptidase/acylaminoacyl peptidase
MPRTTAPALLLLLAACGDDVQAPATAILELTVATAGAPADPDGYTARVDGGQATLLTVNATVMLSGLTPGEHEIALDGLASNCQVAGANPRPVSMAPDEVTRIRFDVKCDAPADVGSLNVVTRTSGPRPDPDGYVVTVAGAPQPIGATGSLTVPGLPLGSVALELTDVATNCRVNGENPRTVTVVSGGPVVVPFEVTCEVTAEGLVLFTSNRTGAFHLYRVQDDGTGERDLTPTGATGGDWSPDGSRIVFSAPAGTESALYVMNADGSEPRPLGVRGIRPRWSSDGRSILFSADGMVMVMAADGTGAASIGEGYTPDWSPDGTEIAFSRIDRSRCVADLFCPSDIFVAAKDGSGLRKVASAANASDDLGSPDWSPDGTRIAISRSCCFLGPDEGGIYVVAEQGGVPRRIYEGPAGTPLWSPDGSVLAFAAIAGGATDVMVIPAEGGAAVRLAGGPGSQYPQAWR